MASGKLVRCVFGAAIWAVAGGPARMGSPAFHGAGTGWQAGLRDGGRARCYLLVAHPGLR